MTIISTESEIGEPSSNSGHVCCVHSSTNVLMKLINQILFPPVMGSLTFGGSQSNGRIILNLKKKKKTRRKGKTTTVHCIKKS